MPRPPRLRAGHDKAKIQAVKTALGDGELDVEDVELLEELLPPEPREDWERLLVFLTAEQGYIKTIFRWYALQGTVGSDDVEVSRTNRGGCGRCCECSRPGLSIPAAILCSQLLCSQLRLSSSHYCRTWAVSSSSSSRKSEPWKATCHLRLSDTCVFRRLFRNHDVWCHSLHTESS